MEKFVSRRFGRDASNEQTTHRVASSSAKVGDWSDDVLYGTSLTSPRSSVEMGTASLLCKRCALKHGWQERRVDARPGEYCKLCGMGLRRYSYPKVLTAAQLLTLEIAGAVADAGE